MTALYIIGGLLGIAFIIVIGLGVYGWWLYRREISTTTEKE